MDKDFAESQRNQCQGNFYFTEENKGNEDVRHGIEAGFNRGGHGV